MTTTLIPLHLPSLLDDWRRHLRARGKSPRTVVSYLQVADAFTRWLAGNGRSLDARDVQLADVEGYLVHVRDRTSAANEAKHYRSLQQLWRWLVDVEEELPLSPMAKLSPPHVPVKPVPVIPDDVVVRLLATCAGPRFIDRRDTAIIRLLLDTGMRAGELLGLDVADVDWRYEVAHVMGKGEKPRACPFGPKTGDALRRYLRARAAHRYAAKDPLWLGLRGPIGHDALAQMLNHRCAQAFAGKLHPHQFRHTFAHQWSLAGGGEVDLMRLMGWTTREMVARYGASAADHRAHEAHRRMNLGDRI
jgi:site-specific recombinase XerD